jgi:RNA polymerase sigma factor (sigma-70 family)
MKKHRKQNVIINGEKRLADVPVDSELYKADNREEYQRVRSRRKHVSLDSVIIAGISVDIVEIHEESQLLEHLREALQLLSNDERRLIECIYYNGLTERETAAIFNISQPAVTKRKHKIISKLRKSLNDWA